jgi:hypothetical protein
MYLPGDIVALAIYYKDLVVYNKTIELLLKTPYFSGLPRKSLDSVSYLVGHRTKIVTTNSLLDLLAEKLFVCIDMGNAPSAIPSRIFARNFPNLSPLFPLFLKVKT